VKNCPDGFICPKAKKYLEIRNYNKEIDLLNNLREMVLEFVGNIYSDGTED